MRKREIVEIVEFTEGIKGKVYYVVLKQYWSRVHHTTHTNLVNAKDELDAYRWAVKELDGL